MESNAIQLGNTRTMKDAERMNMFLGMTAGKRLTYRMLTRKNPVQ